MLALEDLVGLHRSVQLQLLQHYWLGHWLVIKWFALETIIDHMEEREGVRDFIV